MTFVLPVNDTVGIPYDRSASSTFLKSSSNWTKTRMRSPEGIVSMRSTSVWSLIPNSPLPPSTPRADARTTFEGRTGALQLGSTQVKRLAAACTSSMGPMWPQQERMARFSASGMAPRWTSRTQAK